MLPSFFHCILRIAFLLNCILPCETDVARVIPSVQNYLPIIDRLLDENSGLIYWNDLLWTINDNGGKNELYGIDTISGLIKVEVVVANALNHDWEDIAQDDEYIYIEDAGNNKGVRRDLSIVRIDKKYISKSKKQIVQADLIHFSYRDQTTYQFNHQQTRFDCEAMVIHDSEIVLFTKDWSMFKTKVYTLPTQPGYYSISPIDSFDTKGMVTGADISEGKLILVGYKDFKSFIWAFDITPKSLFSQPVYYDLQKIGYAQTEGICFMDDQQILMSCEKNESNVQQIWKVVLTPN